MRLNQLQSEFLATVSHELKTPIASMELTSSLIRAGELTADEVCRLWASHDKELKRLRAEVESLLEAARWQGKPVRMQKEPIHLESWISQSLERWKALLGPGSSVVRSGDALDTEARLDVRMLNLITDNLVDNSRKFSGSNPRLTIETRRIAPTVLFGRSRWQISFRDQGCGFDPADSRRIFTRFFRAKTGSTEAIPGTGLGLYIARSASKALGLTLRGQSGGIGAGAVFTIEGAVSPEAGQR
jgi:signal transduction histidine kinase